jgi:hypothetical protein
MMSKSKLHPARVKRVPKTRRKSTRRPSAKVPRARVAAPRVSSQAELNLDWDELCGRDNGRSFEDLGLDLFAEKYGDVQLIPNAPRAGRDGGADGIFNGAIGRVGGPWKVACAVRQTFPEAMKKVRHENKLARKAKQSGLFFITSYKAHPTEVAALEKEAAKGLKAGRVWSCGHLTRMLRDYPWLRQVYFGHELIPGFVPMSHSAELDDQNQPDIEIVGRDAELATLTAHLGGERGRIAIIEATGGSGKSRLLRAIPAFLGTAQPRRSVWLRRPGVGTIEKSLRSGLPARRPMLLALDDAGEALDEVRELVRLAADGTLNVNVVLAIRSVDHDRLMACVGGLRGAVSLIRLAPLSTSDGARIAKSECPSLSTDDAARLAQAFGTNLFLLRAAAQLLARGESPGQVVDDEHIRGLVARRFIGEAEKHLRAHMPESEVPTLLAELALTVPLSEKAAGKDARIATLSHAGLLRRVGNTLRFRRDVEGDVLLAHLIEIDSHRTTIVRVVEAQLDSENLERLLRNLSSAGKGSASAVIARMVRGWRADPSLLGSWRRVLQLLPYCARAAVDEVSELCAYVASCVSLGGDDVGPTILAVGHVEASKGIQLAGNIARAGFVRGRFSNYHPRGLCDSVLNPFGLDSPDVELGHVCEVVGRWLDGSVPPQLGELIENALKSLFSTVARWNTSSAMSLTLHERALPAVEPILAVRRKATSLLARTLAHPERHVRLHGIEVLEDHGGPNIGRVSTRAFEGAAAEEFNVLLPTIRERLEKEADTEVWFRLYEVLAHRWALLRPGASHAAELLRGRSVDPIVKAFHFSENRTEWFWSFDDVEQSAPAMPGERWPWWVQNHLSNRADHRELDRVVDALCDRYSNPDGVIRCATEIVSTTCPSWVLDAWCRRAPDLFHDAAQAVADGPVRALLIRALARTRYREDPSAGPNDLFRLPRPIREDEVVAILESFHPTPEQAIEIARFLADDESMAIRRRAISVIQHRADVDPASALSVLAHVLRDGDWSGDWSLIWSTLHNAERRPLIGEQTELRTRIEAQLLLGDDSFSDGWHQQQIAQLLYGNGVAARLALLTRLFELKTYASATRVGLLSTPLLDDDRSFAQFAQQMKNWIAGGSDDSIRLLDIALNGLRRNEFPDSAFETASELARSADVNAQKTGVILLSRLPTRPEACAQIAALAAGPKSEVQELAIRHLWSFRWPRGVYGRSIGEPAPAMLTLRDALQGALAQATRDARPLIAEVLASLQANLEAEKLEDEEDLEPR